MDLKNFFMDSSEFYRLTLSSVFVGSDWSGRHEDVLGVISYTSPYVFSHNSEDVSEEESVYSSDSHLYKSVTDKDITNEYIRKYFSSFNNIKSNSVDSGLLSPGLKAIGTNYLVFEKPPCFKNIFYVPTVRSDVELESQQVFRIPIPWQLYFVKFNSDMYTYEVRMFFMKSSLASVDQQLFLPPLPNFYTNGMLCPPIMDNMEDVERYPKNHAGIMQCAYDWVWNSGTNHDLTEACLHLAIQLNKDDSVLKHMSELIYNNYFKNNILSKYSANYKQVSHLLAAWENSSLTEVCNLSWPNLSGLKPNFFYSDISNETEGYYDHLYDFIYYQDDSLSEEDVNYMIENEDYNVQEYNQYLRSNNLIPYLSVNPWDKSYLYSDILPELILSIRADFGFLNSNLCYDINAINVNNNV